MLDHIARHTLPAAYAVLPTPLASAEASALLLAIGLQESRFRFRAQVHGPARGFWQFEVNGVAGVLEHDRSQFVIAKALNALRYDHTIEAAVIQPVLEHNDVLAACFARALLLTSPVALPGPDDVAHAWALYTDCWRPGRPHRGTWTGFYAEAWAIVRPGRPIPRMERA
jgi:hypothetical protein